MKTLFFNEHTLDLGFIKSALLNNGVIGFPTETVYGLGAFISQDDALKKIYELKIRSPSKALTIHASKIEKVFEVSSDITDDFFLLAEHFLPGPLTIILKKKKSISSLISPYETIGFRVPSHPLALKVLSFLDEPLVGTSANISSSKSPVSAKEVMDVFDGKISCVIDGGQCPIGVASTVISLVGEIKILRVGSISKEEIEKVLKIMIL
jgi:L-threonylcarbamoyladenylate synthase